MFCECDEHQTDGASADDEHTITGSQLSVFHALDDTSEGFSESSVAEHGARLQAEHVLLDYAGGDDNGLGIRAVEEEEVIAEIFLLMLTEEARTARSRVCNDNT